MDHHYSSTFYDGQRDASVRSAERVVPYLTDLLAPQSVLDVGCGVGGWVRAFKSAGVTTAHGVDGPWARESGLLIPEVDFSEFDFLHAPTPYSPEGLLERYDLVTTFEVVEHLPHNRAADLADFFATKADAVVIGGAIPGQGGSHHINEQWPSYWAKLMSERGYKACDFIRFALWDDDDILPWYKQNSIGYFKNTVPACVVEHVKNEWERRIYEPLSLVHPGLFAGKCRDSAATMANVLKMTKVMTRRLGKWIIGRGQM